MLKFTCFPVFSWRHHEALSYPALFIVSVRIRLILGLISRPFIVGKTTIKTPGVVQPEVIP